MTAAGSSRRQEYAEATRNAVLQGAAACFSTTGFGATTVDAVAAAARVSKGTVYHHFKDKAALFEAVLRRQLLWLSAEVSAGVLAEGAPERRLAAALGVLLQRGAEDRALGILRAEAAGALGAERAAALEAEAARPWLGEALGHTGHRAGDPVAQSLLLAVISRALTLAATGQAPPSLLAAKVAAMGSAAHAPD